MTGKGLGPGIQLQWLPILPPLRSQATPLATHRAAAGQMPMPLIDRALVGPRSIAPARIPGVWAFAPTGELGTSTAVVSERRAVVAPGALTETAKAITRFNGISWAGRLAANGHRDTAILIPRGTDLDKPIEIMVLFHGNGGTAASYTKWMGPYITKLPQHGRNAIVVIPTVGVRKNWMSPQAGESLIGVQDQTVVVAEQLTGRHLKIGSYTVAGFSGGGLPIATAAKAGELRAQHINLFDSTYADWGDVAVRLRQLGATVNAFYTEHNRERAERLRGIPGVSVEASTTDHGGTLVKYFYR